MTIMAAEAGAGAATAEGTAATRAARRTTRTGGKTSQGKAPVNDGAYRGRFGPARPTSTPPRSGGKTQQGSRGGGARPRTGGKTSQGTQRARSTRTAARAGTTNRVVDGSTAPSPRTTSNRSAGTQRRGGQRIPSGLTEGQSRTSYQAVVLAEFVAAVLLVAATPFAKKSADGVSPYVGKDLLQLVALTLVYFLLALVSTTNRGAGRFAAWFGALILLTVGLAEAARLAKLLNVFGLTAPPDPADNAPQEVM